MKKISTLLILVVAALGVSAIPVLNWPFTWVTTYFHEISHGIVALLTGGTVHNIRMHIMGSGLCEVQGGWPALVAFSGYAGAVLWGVVIYLIAESMHPKNASYFAKGLAIMVFITLLLWARDIITIGILTVILTMLLLTAKVRSAAIGRIIIQFVGIYILLNAISSPFHLIDGRHYGDGATLSDITKVPEIIWVILWGVIGFSGLFFVWRKRGDEENSTSILSKL